MADESFELEDGEVAPSVMNGPSPSAATDVQRLRAQLHEAATVLRQRGQADLARLALGLVDADLRDATWVLDDPVHGGGGDFSGDPALFDAFRHRIHNSLLIQRQADYDEDVITEAFPAMVLEAAQHAARLVRAIYDGIDGQLEKQTFIRAAAAGGNDDDDGRLVTECSICFEEFVDGGQVAVMPCPSRVHRFHPDCISKWLAINKMCPLCRHELQLPACFE